MKPDVVPAEDTVGEAVPAEEAVPSCDNCDAPACVFDNRAGVSPAKWCAAHAPDNSHLF